MISEILNDIALAHPLMARAIAEASSKRKNNNAYIFC